MLTNTHFRIDVRSHHFKLTAIQPNARPYIDSFAKSYVQYGLIKEGRRFIRAPVKVFAARTKDFSEYRFHINQYARFLEHIKRSGVMEHNYEVTVHTATFGQAIEIAVLSKWSPLPHQPPIIEYLGSDEPSKIKLVEIQTGRGKAQTLTSKVKIPGGWKLMGQIEIGDVVTAWDGSPCQVTGVFPQGITEVYKVTFSDGRCTHVCPDHLWKVYYVNTTPHKRWRIVNTVEMLRLISMPNPRVYVPLCESEEGDDVGLPMDPYILGVILGDGGTSGTSITITKADEELFEQVKERLPDNLTITDVDHLTKRIIAKSGGINPYITILRDLGLMGKRSWEKHIPEQYLHASTEQRWALLQGLMDTDGTANKLEEGGSISYCSTSLELAQGVQYLVRSLGGIASISNKQTQYTYLDEKKDGRPSFVVNIRMKTPSRLFTIPRKKVRTNDDNQYAADLKLRVVSVEKDYSAETQCISINHPDRLYVTDDFIVTHNTFCAMSGAANLGLRFAICIRPMYIDKWVEDVAKVCGIQRKEVIVVQGSTQLMQVIALGRSGELEKLGTKAIIFSNKTLQLWFTLYESMGQAILDQGYDCLPDELFETLGCGLRIIDEVHQDFHLNFKIDLYTHVGRSISLSATLKADDPFLNQMYEVAYPKPTRYAGLAYNRYVDSIAWMYRLDKPNEVRTTEWGSTKYSHSAFEKSIMKRPKLLSAYLEMVVAAANLYHFKEYRQGDRLLVYFFSIEMCTIASEYFKSTYPHLDVRRYVEDDPYENVIEAEISASTILSAGTGVDIPMLTTVLMTHSISSTQSNVQGFGRLREIPGRVTRFVYFTCTDLEKQVQYHIKKEELLAHMAKRQTTHNYPYLLGR